MRTGSWAAGRGLGPIAFQSMPFPKWGGVVAPGARPQWAPLAPRRSPPRRRSPAHDLVGQQHAAHLRVLVLTLVDDGLRGDKQRRGLRGAQQPRASRAAGAWGRGEASQPPRPRSRQGHPAPGLGQGGLSSRAPAGPAPALDSGRGGGRLSPGVGSEDARTHPGAAAAGHVLQPLSTPGSNPCVGRGRSERAAAQEARWSREGRRRPGSRPARPLPAFPPRSPRWAARPGPSTAPRPGARAQPPHVAGPGGRPAGVLGAPGRLGRAATCSSPGDIWKESANGQSGVYFETANNDFSRVKRQCLCTRSGGF